MIIDEYVEIRINAISKKHYSELGYKIPTQINRKGNETLDNKTPIKVKITDLTNGSHATINVKCDFCGEEKQVVYKNYYNQSISKNEPYACEKCAYDKSKMNFLRDFGVENNMQLKSFREKSKKTLMNNYGVESPLQSKEIYNKLKETSIERFGVDCSLKSKEVREKIKKTNLSKYGFEYPTQSSEIREKIVNVCLEKYGVKHIKQYDLFKLKASNTMYENGSCPTSNQQNYLCLLYEGILNYNCSCYNLDIFLPDECIDIEYDGSGHNLSMRLGDTSKKDFLIKEIIRSKIIKSNGIKIMRIVSKTDKLPSDIILLHMLEMSKKYLTTTNHTWIEWYVDDNIYKNAENLNGSFFDYGKIRKIKKSDICEVAPNV